MWTRIDHHGSTHWRLIFRTKKVEGTSKKISASCRTGVPHFQIFLAPLVPFVVNGYSNWSRNLFLIQNACWLSNGRSCSPGYNGPPRVLTPWWTLHKHFILVFTIFGMPSQVGQIRFGGKDEEKNVLGLLLFAITPIHWMISIFSMGFLRGNEFDLKLNVNFMLWPMLWISWISIFSQTKQN